MKQLALDTQSTYPDESDKIENDIYADDLFTEWLEELQGYYKNIHNILMTGNSTFKTWKFNIFEIKIDSCSKYEIKHPTNGTARIIVGAYLDQFEFIVNDVNLGGPVTKRKTLEKTAELMGLMSPTIFPKLLIQRFWYQKTLLGWICWFDCSANMTNTPR